MTREQIDNIFTYHKPFGDQPARYVKIRTFAKSLANVINDCTPDSLEKDTALNLLKQAVMSANAGIAINESHLAPAEEVGTG